MYCFFCRTQLTLIFSQLYLEVKIGTSEYKEYTFSNVCCVLKAVAKLHIRALDFHRFAEVQREEDVFPFAAGFVISFHN